MTRELEDTGERMVPTMRDRRVVYEHLHRYHFAASFAGGKRVLDLASGEGYGAAILVEAAAHVVGVEIDGRAVRHSREKYGSPKLEFQEGSIVDLGRFPAQSFDLVVCFEAIEHVAEQEQLVHEARRVLREDGLFVLSTPNRDVYNATLAAPNEFHVRELDERELVRLLEAHFPHVAFWGQRLAVGSELVRMDDAEGAAERIAVRLHDDEWHRSEDAPDVYLVCIASTRALPELPRMSFLVDPDLTVIREATRSSQVAWDQVAQMGLDESAKDEVLRRAVNAERALAFMARSRGWRFLESARRVIRPLRAALPRFDRRR